MRVIVVGARVLVLVFATSVAPMLNLSAFSQRTKMSTESSLAVPVPAVAAGFRSLTFDDEFDSMKTIDVNTTEQQGYNWYTDFPFGGGRTLPPAYSISNGVLTVTSTGWTANWALSSFSSGGNVGHSFQYGYFEARMRFDPTLGPQSQGGPAFWAESTNWSSSANHTAPIHFAELDFFEAYHKEHAAYSGVFDGTLHDWHYWPDIPPVDYHNSNNFHAQPGVDYSQWHIYACLWKPGQVTWYFDGVPLMTQKYSANRGPNPPGKGSVLQLNTGLQGGAFHILDSEVGGMQIILGSSPGWPMQVDYVRVWQNMPSPSLCKVKKRP